MKSRKIKMTIEEFHRLPFRPAWKQEYYKGFLGKHLVKPLRTPRFQFNHDPLTALFRSGRLFRPRRDSLAKVQAIIE